MRPVRGLSYVQSRVSPLYDRSMCVASTFQINKGKNHVWLDGTIVKWDKLSRRYRRQEKLSDRQINKQKLNHTRER